MMGATPSLPENWRGASQQLPRGRHGLSRAFVASNQRERIIVSLAEVSAVKGFRGTTVEDIISHAGVSRRTFYDLFADKQQCFLSAYELIMDRLLEAVDAAYWAGERPWPERMRSGLERLLDWFAADPVFARLVMVEVLVAGRPALERRDAALKRFEAFFAPGRSSLPPALAEQQLLARAVVGGLAETLYARIVAGDLEHLPEMKRDLLYCTLVPFLGHNRAVAIADGELETPAAAGSESVPAPDG